MRQPLRIVALLLLLAALGACAATPPPVAKPAPAATTAKGARAPADIEAAGPALVLGTGDNVTIQVYGRPELALTATVAEDGSITMPLAGRVVIAGLSPAAAGQRIATAFKQGRYLNDPQVTVALAQARGYQVSVLGAVRTPGRYPVEARTTVLDALAQAGGIAENGSTSVVLLRPDRRGNVTRMRIELVGLNQPGAPLPTLTLRGGDSLYVPVASQFYIYGEIKAPNMYRLEPGMTVVQAISRGGGITPRGSDSRIEIKRRQPDGTYVNRSADLGDELQPDDVVRVKERLF